MWFRLRIDDVRTIVHYLGLLVLIIGASMAIPLVIALVLREWNPAIWFALSLGISVSIGAALHIVRPVRPGLSRKQAMIVTGLAWLVGGLVTAMPLWFSGMFSTYFDALFNAISYLSGTGMTLLSNYDAQPVSLEIWQFIMVIIGAQGIVLVAMGLGTISRFSGSGALFQAEAHADRITPQMAGTSRFVAGFMGALIVAGTLVCTLILALTCGFSPANALFHGFAVATSAVATGGVTIMPTGIMYYHSPLLNLVLMTLMFTGTFSFALYFYMAKKGVREFFRDIETRTLIIWGLAIAIVLAIAFAGDGHFGELGIFVDKGLFNLVSAITGTGFTTFTSSQISSVASSAVVFALIMGMVVGGATSSTAGGFKAMRLALALKTIGSEIRRMLMPAHAREVIHFHHFGDQVLTADLARSVMLVILLYLFSFAFGSVLGVAYGYDPISAVLESVSCTANCGMTAGIITPGMPLGLEICYFVQMLAGRLEFLTLLTTLASIASSAAFSATHSRASKALHAAVPSSVKRLWHGEDPEPGGRKGRGPRA